jgi:two-component system sensor histidine kinase CpxA
MYSLFWKIFLTYWLIIVTIEFSTTWITAALSEYEINPILEQQNSQFAANSRRAAAVLQHEGMEEFQNWLQQSDNLEAIQQVFVFDPDGKEINNKPLPAGVAAVAANQPLDTAAIDHRQAINYMLAYNIKTPDSSEYLLVTTFKYPHLFSYLFAPQRIAFSILVSGLICFMLARYFTSPLAKLRRSTQMLALGDFNTADLQQLRHRQDEFGALAVDFEKMTHRLRELLNAQQQLLRDISHELRSPLARIHVALGLAHQKSGSANNSELQRIEREIGRFEFLVQELLTFAKIGPNMPPLSTASVDIRELLDQVVQDARYELQQSHSGTAIHLRCPVDINLTGDARLLHRAIENIVRNACYYSQKHTNINIECSQDDKHITIIIEDEGPGIPPDMLEKIFEPFVRVSAARESDTGGSGIGLAIAKRVVEIHGGTITATNKTNGHGLIVKIVIPLEPHFPATATGSIMSNTGDNDQHE